MITRTHKLVHADNGETLYESTCTMDGNVIKGCINPFPYMNRKMHKLNLHVVKMSETKGDNATITLFVKEA